MTTLTSSAAAAEIGPSEAQKMLSRGEATLIDVREPDEHAAERIAGSRLMPLSAFDPAEVGAFKAGRVIVHCRSGRRSAEALRMLASVPGLEALNLSGGILAWKEQGLPVESSGRRAPINVMRQTQLVIGLGVLTGVALGYFVHPVFLILAAFFGAGLVFAGASGTCGLMSLLSVMPWNRVHSSCPTPKR
jgi:rhodanese-related sulfurtransferase